MIKNFGTNLEFRLKYNSHCLRNDSFKIMQKKAKTALSKELKLQFDEKNYITLYHVSLKKKQKLL